MPQLRVTNPAPPNLPLGTNEYSRQYQDQFSNVLRLYFNQLFNALAGVLGAQGGKYLQNIYGAWHDSTTQTAAANTATLILINAIDFEQGISVVGGSKITVQYAGIYNLEFSIQLNNPGNAADNVTIWYRQNGVDVVNSAGIATAPAKHGSTPGALVFGWNEFFELKANDYLQL